MTLEEINKVINEKEQELKELKRQKLWMSDKKSRVFATTSLRKMFYRSGFWIYRDVDVEELKRKAIIRATNGRTEKLDEITYNEWLTLKKCYDDVAKEKLKELKEKTK